MSDHETYERLIAFLDEHGANYRLIDHEPEGRTEIVSPMRGNDVSHAAKCIVVMVKISKKEKKFILAVVPGDAKVDLNGIKALLGGTYVSFADQERAEELSGCVAGTILPFSFHEDLEVMLDPVLLDGPEEIFFNAARLDRSLAVNKDDFAKIVAEARQENIALYDNQEASAPKAKSNANHEEPEVDDLFKMRHSLAHVLAQAIERLYPGTQLSIGPPIDTGCYYDFLFQKPITDADFEKIEEEMRAIIKEGQAFAVDALSTDDAIAFWKKKNQKFKVELVEDLATKGETEVTNYRNVDEKGNETFVDLCRGGHVVNLREIPKDGFKIMSLAGAYWRGDASRDQLTRIYVAAFPTKKELDEYLVLLEEAKKRDHRKLGAELDLFAFAETVGPGLPMMLPNGEIVKMELERYMREEKERLGYSFVWIPHIAKKELYEKSGHMGKYDAMMPVMEDDEGCEFVLKAMNCPHHFELYNARPHSYKELPLRFAENTTCYRNEKSGELSGLTRVKALTQDDTHHFVMHDQIGQEIEMILGLMERTYNTFGFSNFTVDISVRDPENKDKYFGDDAVWTRAEQTLIDAVKKWGADYKVEEGEAAFYGPKIDIRVKDAIGRDWQLTTVQLDFVQPENFDMTYTGEDGKDHRPAVLHVAILGSSHRFMGVAIEHFAGLFPLWLAPVQIAVLPVAEAHVEYAYEVEKSLRESGMRVIYMDPSESLGKRIREGEKGKVPFLLVIGDKEVEGRSVAARSTVTKEQIEVSLDDFIQKTSDDIQERRLEASIS